MAQRIRSEGEKKRERGVSQKTKPVESFETGPSTVFQLRRMKVPQMIKHKKRGKKIPGSLKKPTAELVPLL